MASPEAETLAAQVGVPSVDSSRGLKLVCATLPPDPERATEFAKAQIGYAWRETAEALTRVYQALLKARQYGLARLSAIVFNGLSDAPRRPLE